MRGFSGLLRMNVKNILFCALFVTATACGTHASKSEDELVQTLNTYMVKVNENHTLGETVVEGALTDNKGQNDIGSFTYYVNYNKDTKDLCHIKNIENTNQTREEHYYYKNNTLVTVLVNATASSDKKIYINKGRIISSLNIAPEEQDLLLAKGERFLKEYKQTR